LLAADHLAAGDERIGDGEGEILAHAIQHVGAEWLSGVGRVPDPDKPLDYCELPAGAKFCLECGEPVASHATAGPRFTSPEAYTPKHLAEKILTSKSGLEGERKQVTVLFADLKGSMELLADRDPEEAR
jgi:hypothetical protein